MLPLCLLYIIHGSHKAQTFLKTWHTQVRLLRLLSQHSTFKFSLRILLPLPLKMSEHGLDKVGGITPVPIGGFNSTVPLANDVNDVPYLTTPVPPGSHDLAGAPISSGNRNSFGSLGDYTNNAVFLQGLDKHLTHGSDYNLNIHNTRRSQYNPGYYDHRVHSNTPDGTATSGATHNENLIERLKDQVDRLEDRLDDFERRLDQYEHHAERSSPITMSLGHPGEAPGVRLSGGDILFAPQFELHSWISPFPAEIGTLAGNFQGRDDRESDNSVGVALTISTSSKSH